MKKKYIVLQEEISDCGVCCLLSIIRYYGGDVPLENLRIETSTSQTGVTALNLLKCAQNYGFTTKGYKNKKLSKIHLPAIAHFNINNSLSHFVVIYKISKTHIEIMDPASGKKILEVKEFYKLFSGVILELIINTKLPKIKKEEIIEKAIRSKLINNYKDITILVILNLLFVILSIIGSTYISFINKYNLIKISILFIFINIISLFIKYLIDNLNEKLHNKIDDVLTNEINIFILNLPLKYIQLKGTGEILKRIEDIDLIKRIKVNNIIKIIHNILIIVPIITILNYYSFIYIKLIIIFISLYLIINKRYHNLLSNLINDELKDATNYNSILTDTINGIVSIHHTNSYKYFLEKIYLNKKESNTSRYKLNKLINKYQLFSTSIITLIEILFNIHIYLMIKNNVYTIEKYFIINILFGLLINSITDILSTIPSIKYKNKLKNKANELLNLKLNETAEQKIKDTTITIENLRYSYDLINYTLNKTNLKIKKGEKYLIKGDSGKGKTTIFKLLNKEIEDYRGSIKIGEIELKQIKKEEINKYISFLSQEETLFKDTIKNNILLGLEVSDEKLNKVISICELKPILDKKPFGLETFLIGGGEELSGGEKQLIILARFLIRNKNILIIDEATSEISENIENKVLNNIMKYYKDKTILFVSHKNKEYLFKNIIELN